MVGKICVVTGSNKGLGLEIVKQLVANSETEKVYGLCRRSSPSLDELAAAASSNKKLLVVPNIDVSKDDVATKLQEVFGTTPIDVLIHNAGASGPPEKFDTDAAMFESQSLTNITMDRMRFTFELNTLGPLRVTQALLPNIKAAATTVTGKPAKVIIISSSAGSIASVESGGLYSYRTSKAAVNMVGANLAKDLKPHNIAVGLIHPGTVFTGILNTRTQYHRDVDVSVKGVLQTITDDITLDNTGVYLDATYGEGAKPISW